MFVLASVFSGFFFVQVGTVYNQGMISSQVISLDDDDWQLARDPSDVGRKQQWWTDVQEGAKQVKVPL